MGSSSIGLIWEDLWRCRDCKRHFRVTLTACQQSEVYVHQQKHYRTVLHSRKRPFGSCLEVVPSAFPFLQCQPRGFSSVSSPRPPDLYSWPSSSFLPQPSCSSRCLSPRRTFPSPAFTRSSLSPLCVLVSEASSSSDPHPFSASTCTSLPSRQRRGSPFSHLSPRQSHFATCHGLQNRQSRGYWVCSSSFSFFSWRPRNRSLSRSQARELSRSFSSSRSLILPPSSSISSSRPLSDLCSSLLLTRPSSVARRFSTESLLPHPFTTSSSSLFSSYVHFSSGFSRLAAAFSSPLNLPRVSSPVFSAHDRLGSLLYLSQRPYRRGRKNASRRQDEEPRWASSSLSSHQADQGSFENIEETRTRDVRIDRSVFTYRELPEEDDRRKIQKEEATDEGIDQYKSGEEKFSNCGTNAPSVPQRSSGSSSIKKINKVSSASDVERDFSASFPSSGIPGDAFVEFTTESVARLWGRDQPERRKEGGVPAGGSKGKLVERRGTEVEEEVGDKDEDSSKNYGRRRKRARGGTARRGDFAGEEEERQGKGQSRRLLFSPIDDADLRHLPFETLDAQRLLYVLGRASVLVEAEVQDAKSGDSMEMVSSSPGDSKRGEDDDLFSHTDTLPLSELSRREREGLPAPASSLDLPPFSTLPRREEEEDKAKETISSSSTPFTFVSPSGGNKETSRCSVLADDLDFWISIYMRLGNLLPSLSPREFSRAVQGLGYVRPRLIQLAEKTLLCKASETGTQRSRNGDTAAPRETKNHGGTRVDSLTGAVHSDEDHVSHPAITNGGKSRSPSVMSSTKDSHLLREEVEIHRRKEEKAGVSWVSVEHARKFLELDGNLVVQLRRHVGLQATQFHGDCLSRVFYGMVRGQMEGDPQFLDFFTSEVLERFEKKLRPWHVHKMFMVSLSSPHVSRDFQSVLGNHLVSNLAYLPAKSFSEFIPKLVESGLVRPAHVIKINIISGKRLRAWNDSTLLLSLGYPLIMYDLITPGNAIALFRTLQKLGLPEPYPTKDKSMGSLPLPLVSSEDEGEYRRAVRRINKHLIPLKLMEIRLRIDRPNVYATFSPPLRSWLKAVRDAPLTLTSFGHPFEQAHVNAPLLQGAAELCKEQKETFFFHPHLEGPFLLELASPLSQISLEWDEPWCFYPAFQEYERRVYTDCRRNYLRHEGWKVVTVSASAFRALEETDRKRWIVEELKKVTHHVLKLSATGKASHVL
ncbi:asparagine-rich protein [Cystoisospora suis]|uniref:Asparagine-rich protein n=1 Tax=Cystoisospora suis TaxID=483139 RepID=A0A2C6L9Z8_9APIC|nr:asparagine-rich protein [Cystoisospora suis]